MMKKNPITFAIGGIHPPENKVTPGQKNIMNSFFPSRAVIPLSQHIGAPAEALVQPGDTIREEMLIARAASFVSAPIHSSIPGKVTEIKEIFLPSGRKSQAIVIEMEGEFDYSGKKRRHYNWQEKSKSELMDLIKDNGIVGMGGATFPTHVKFSIPEGKKVEHLIINGAECEPYLSSDHFLLTRHAQEICEGLHIVKKILNPDRISIGIENNKPDAIEILTQQVKELPFLVDIVPLQLKYPQGDEKQLIQAICGKEVPSGKLPLEVGAVVSNTATIFAIYEAVVFHKPLIERMVSVAGKAVRNPATLKVRIGTSFRELFWACGGFKKPPKKIVAGGPMMGFTVYDLDTPVTKGTSGILALTDKEIKSSSRTNCIQCGRCVAACPMALNPTRLFKYIDHQLYKEAQQEGIMDCRECGCCAYSCPAMIPLVQGFRLGKLMISKKK